MTDSRETLRRDVFVVGWPVKHSRSPLIHNHWLEQFGLAERYRIEAVPPQEFSAFIAGLKAGDLPYRGGNVTIPHKETALALADDADALAEEIGAANTLWIEKGRLRATNTDGHGFIANLDDRHPGWDRTSRAVILGAGGAARAVIQALRDRGLGEIHIVNRTLSRAQELADRFGPKIHAHPLAALGEVLAGAGLFVNATSLGMDGGEAPKIDFSPLDADALVTDLVYVPLKTPFLLEAERQGFAVVDGLGMLLHQAVPGFEKWFARRPQVDGAVRRLVIADLEATA